MKSIRSVFIGLGLLATTGTGLAQTAAVSTAKAPPPAAYREMTAQRGANHKVWQRETHEKLPNGRVVTNLHSYTELASGLNYKDAKGQWQSSEEVIESYPGGAIARQGQQQVIFANNLNSYGAIDLQTPDGKRLRSNPLGLMYHDPATDEAVLIARVQDSPGELISSNQVLYPNAFDGVKADVRYTYKKGSFEQDVILREQPPSPELYGMNLATTEIEVMTEFLNPPPENIKTVSQANGEVDQNISWGATRLGRGTAFDLGETDRLWSQVAVVRQYLAVGGRKVLLEKVKLKDMEALVGKLPLRTSVQGRQPTMAFNQFALPLAPPVQREPVPMRLAINTPSYQGYVLDYVTLNSSLTNFTFQGDTTYFVSGGVNLSGVTTIAGGAVIKMDYYGGLGVDQDGTIECKTAAYRPAIFTSKNDDTVGETIDGSSGQPSSEDAWGIQGVNSGNPPLHDLRFSYCYYGIGSPWETMDLWNCQFVNVNTPIYGGNIGLHNVLITGADSRIELTGNLVAENVTADSRAFVWVDSYDGEATLALTNCLIVGDLIFDPDMWSGPATVLTNATVFPSSWPFQTAGGGGYYLPSNSPYHGAGTTNISPALLAGLRQKTTWPPQVYSNVTISTNLTLSPQAPRDTNATPDIGYHYDPLDYELTGVNYTNGTLTILPGTVLGINLPWATDGLTVNGTGQMVCQGTPAQPIIFASATLVQEQASELGSSLVAADCAFQFTKFIAGQLVDPLSGASAPLQNCEFYGGGNLYSWATQIINCLFVEVMTVDWWGGATTNIMCNNTFVECGVIVDASTDNGGVVIADNLFDSGFMCNWAGGYGVVEGGYNAFYNCEDHLGPDYYSALATDIALTNAPDYQAGPLGNYYLPTGSPLINTGSTNANLLGLYHFTTQTSQVKETNSIVDIGHHYVATDENGNPLSTLWFGTPDYLADTNGELAAWQMYYFGQIGLNPGGFDANGNTLLYDYMNNLTPTVFTCTGLEVPNNYVSSSQPAIQLDVAGTPYYVATLVDDNNFSNAVWNVYSSSNVTVNLGSAQGWHEVWIGLRGHADDPMSAVWQRKRLKLDWTPPALFITNPTNNTVDIPMIQVQGYSPEALSSISYDLSNAAGTLTNQPVLVLNQHYDPNTWEFTTNTFQAFDVVLTNGVNSFTLRATDLAGNVTTLATNFTLDYSAKTNPPGVQITWPQPGTEVSGSRFTVDGQVGDATIAVAATITDANGHTNTVKGLVERTGKFWVENLPLSSGTNTVTLTVTDAAGNSATTNFNVAQSAVTLTVNPVGNPQQLWQPTVTLTGTISDAAYAVWVNGVKGHNNGDGTWTAGNVPVNSGGTASFTATAYAPNEQQPDGAYGNP